MAVAQLTVGAQDLGLDPLLQQQPPQPPVEKGAALLPLKDVLKRKTPIQVASGRSPTTQDSA